MSALRHLRCLARGRHPADDGLLGSARFGWGGLELLSEEAILAAFAAQPFVLEGGILEVETPQSAALIGETEALYADLYDGRVGRLWRVGSTPEGPCEPAVDVAFDADMRQERGDLAFRAEDHPCLDSVASEIVVERGRELLERLRHHGNLRVRGFVTRAGGTPETSAALIALYTLTNEPSRAASFRFAVLGFEQGAQAREVVDPARPRRWTPRL